VPGEARRGIAISFAALALALATHSLACVGFDGAGTPLAASNQALMETKIYAPKHVPASELAPLADAVLRKASAQGSAESVSMNGRALLLVNAPREMSARIDEMLARIDSPPQAETEGKAPDLKGFSSYKPRFIPLKGVSAMIATLSLEMGGDGKAIQDQEGGRALWKSEPKLDEAVKKLMAKADVPQSQMRVVFKAYSLTPRTVGVMGEILLSRRPEDVKAPDAAILATISGCGGVKLLASSECSVVQGIIASKALIEAEAFGKISATVSAPVVSESGGKAESIYSDFVFDSGSDIRNVRWTLKAGVEKPLAAFSVYSSGKGNSRVRYLDISSLPSVFRGGDKAAATGEMLVITGLATQASE